MQTHIYLSASVSGSTHHNFLCNTKTKASPYTWSDVKGTEGRLSGRPHSFCWLSTICCSPMWVRWTSVREVLGGQDFFWVFLPNWNTQQIRKRGSGVMLVIKNTPAKARVKRHRFDPWVRKILWRRKWQSTPVFLPGKFHRWKSLEGYNPWGGKESDTTEPLTHRVYQFVEYLTLLLCCLPFRNMWCFSIYLGLLWLQFSA